MVLGPGRIATSHRYGCAILHHPPAGSISNPQRAPRAAGRCPRSLLARATATRHRVAALVLAAGPAHQNRAACHRDPARDAVVSSPRAVLVLHRKDLGRHVAIPTYPLRP